MAGRIERFPLARPSPIARDAGAEAVVLVATVEAGPHRGRGEAVPSTRLGETPTSALGAVEAARGAVEAGATRGDLLRLLPAGAARNALDAALWDLDAKRLGLRASDLAGLHRVAPAVTAFTLRLDRPGAMARAAAAAADRPILRVALGGPDDESCLRAVRDAAPEAALIVDAGEGWPEDALERRLGLCAEIGVELVEAPLPAGRDAALGRVARSVPVCAGFRSTLVLSALADRYDAVSVGLDEAGGLTAALLLADEAERLGLALVVGCGLCSSLGAAPAALLTPRARFVILDGPLRLARDREPGLRYVGSTLFPPEPKLWG